MQQGFGTDLSACKALAAEVCAVMLLAMLHGHLLRAERSCAMQLFKAQGLFSIGNLAVLLLRVLQFCTLGLLMAELSADFLSRMLQRQNTLQGL